jgi:hypothetical protein
MPHWGLDRFGWQNGEAGLEEQLSERQVTEKVRILTSVGGRARLRFCIVLSGPGRQVVEPASENSVAGYHEHNPALPFDKRTV